MTYSVTVLAPHLVQYHAPVYQALAQSPRIALKVLFQDKTGAVPTRDATMGADIAWDSSLLSGYDHTFLKNWSPVRSGGSFLGRINPGVVPRLLFGNSDAVLIQGYQSFTNLASFISLLPRRTKILFRGEATLRSSTSGLKERVKRSILRSVFSMSDVVFYSVPGNLEFFRHYGCPERKLYPLPCAVDNDFFRRQRSQYAPQRDEIRRSLGFSPSTTVFLLAGRMSAYKGHDDLLDAASHARQHGHDVGFIFAGDGPLRPHLENRAAELSADQVRFPGFLSPAELSRYYVASDVLAICSDYDPSPKVLNEAMNFELPLIVSDAVGQIGDSARHMENAIVYPSGDTSALTAAIESLAGNSSLRRQMGKCSLELSDRFSLKTDVCCFVDALDSILNK